MKANGDEVVVDGLTEPAPFEVIVTVVALENVLPLIVTELVPHVLPEVLLKLRAGAFVQPHDTVNGSPVVVQPDAFLTVIVWLPLATPENVTDA